MSAAATATRVSYYDSQPCDPAVHLPVRLATNTNTAACTNPSVCAKFGLNYLTRDCGMNLGDLLKPPTNGYQQYMRATRYVDTACLKDSVIDSVYYYLADGKCHPSYSGFIWFTANCTTGTFTQYTDQDCLRTPNATSVRGDSRCIDQHLISALTGGERHFNKFDVGCLDGGALLGMLPQPVSTSTPSTSSIPFATPSTTPSSVGTSDGDDAADIRREGDPASSNTWKIAVGVAAPIVLLGLLALAYFFYRRRSRAQTTKSTTLPSVVQPAYKAAPSVPPVAPVIPAERYHAYAPSDAVHSTAVHTDSHMSAASTSRVGTALSMDGSVYSHGSSAPTRQHSLYQRNPTLAAPPQYETIAHHAPAEPQQEVAVASHTPGSEDELGVAKGDVVVVETKYDDGWVYGRNVWTGAKGVFPERCVGKS